MNQKNEGGLLVRSTCFIGLFRYSGFGFFNICSRTYDTMSDMCYTVQNYVKVVH
jgi:hypothetical protein